MDSTQAREFIQAALKIMKVRSASDLIIVPGAKPGIKINGDVTFMGEKILFPDDTRAIAQTLMDEGQWQTFMQKQELNFAVSIAQVGRFRANALIQRSSIGLVFRSIHSEIPAFSALGVPQVASEWAMLPRGLVIVTGATSSGKTTTMAAMVDYRNTHLGGHTITMEDPVEYVHRHKKGIVTQREVGVDTESYETALKNALRQSPDAILVGEVRSREVMEETIRAAETGHLVLCTLHATNAPLAIERALDLFPLESRDQVRQSLALELKGVLAQRLVPKQDGSGRVLALEVLINTMTVAELIHKGQIPEIRDIMSRSRESGMQTFDQSIFDFYDAGLISYDTALLASDRPSDLRLRIKLESKRGQPVSEKPMKDIRIL